MSVQGPMARTADDLALLFSAIVGPDPRVPIALSETGDAFHPIHPLDLGAMRIALAPDLGGLPVERAIRDAVLALGKKLERAGANVELACPDLRDAREIFHVLRANSFRARFRELTKAQRATLKDTIVWNLEAGERLTTDDLDRAWAARAALYRRVAEFFGRFDLLLGPTTQVLPFPVTTDWVREIDGVPMRDYLEWMQSCAQITVTGCPAISVPNGFSAEGLPIGAQFVAPVREDARLLGIAKAVEALP
jgi:amidase